MATPSYLKLLQNIAKGEGGAEIFLNKWAETSKDPDVQSALRFVAMREGEHAYAFRKRVMELTGECMPDAEAQKALMETAGDPNMSDREKFEKLQLTKPPDGEKPDLFCKMFDNKDLDPVTGGLLGRYIAEERDSGRVFAKAYEALVAKEPPKPAAKAAPAAAGGGAALVGELERLSKLKTDGALNEAEFNAAKAALLAAPASKM